MASPGSSSSAFEIQETFWQAILAHVAGCLPEEACGLVAVERKENSTAAMEPGNRAAAVLPIENELHSPTRYRMAPAEQLKAFYWLEESNLDLGAIFHSHPSGPDHPSATDLAEFAYPGVLMLIVSPSPQSRVEWQIRAYQIDGGFSSRLSASEVRLVRIAEL